MLILEIFRAKEVVDRRIEVIIMVLQKPYNLLEGIKKAPN